MYSKSDLNKHFYYQYFIKKLYLQIFYFEIFQKKIVLNFKFFIFSTKKK